MQLGLVKSPVLPPRGMLKYDSTGGRCADDGPGSGDIRRVAYRPLAFDEDDLWMFGLVRSDDLGLELSDDEVSPDRIERDAVLRALQQPGLPGRDECSLDSELIQCVSQDDRGRALADGRVSPEHRDSDAWEILRQIPEVVQLVERRLLAYVGDRSAARPGDRGEFGIFREILVQSADDIYPGFESFSHRLSEGVWQSSTDRCDTDDEMIRLHSSSLNEILQ